MKVTKKMIDDMFNIITAVLDAYATVDPNAKTLTTKQLVVDVLAKTFDSLKADIEKYFVQAGTQGLDISTEAKEELLARARSISAKADDSKVDTFEKLWAIAEPVLDLILDTAKSNLPKDSTALNAIITSIDAIVAMGDQLKKDLPKLQQNPQK